MIRTLDIRKAYFGLFRDLEKNTMTSGIPGPKDQEERLGQGTCTLGEAGQIREYLSKLDIHDSMGPDKMLRELADVIVRPLSMIIQ
ncbi:hypothetical protein DUI87_18197 [Hirundo rustica rustica]|uniref:Uncharacterized protein n=1 Tax=Hirundo rustica rustica TaxID=333673 RepID=A0A3M0JVI5_HIRRU|nr:hypothetical protein DUI87_18197 [Hirundo rustica rustica]